MSKQRYLAKCPYCGSDGILMSWGYMAEYQWTVECSRVLCHVRSNGHTRSEAVKRWNDGDVVWVRWTANDEWDANLMVERGLTHWRSNCGAKMDER